MDKGQKQRFDWLPAQMPGVAALVKDRRKEVGDLHFNECWRRGVLLGEAGWFFAREGAIAVGTPDPAWLKDVAMDIAAAYSTSSLLITKKKETVNGAD